jgi:hypothetical protein
VRGPVKCAADQKILHLRTDNTISDVILVDGVGSDFTSAQFWSLYGAQWSQPMASGGKWSSAKAAQKGENRCGALRPVA